MESSTTNQNLHAAKLAFLSSLVITEQVIADSMGFAVDATTGECPENFKCNICHQLVYDPQECGSCNQLFCKRCILDWTNKGGHKNCPLCQAIISPQ